MLVVLVLELLALVSGAKFHFVIEAFIGCIQKWYLDVTTSHGIVDCRRKRCTEDGYTEETLTYNLTEFRDKSVLFDA